ncbi:MAG: hypothetical protein M0R46_00660 [Candidatus Muirbacterium halophilum]|nr:hypothetical protein [Candidatus Muirbacterium halophilum]MCK9474405.1 hypothetical protein [Candidatus Muirbacterium halophilum]
MKKSIFFIVVFSLFISVFSETLIMKNGNLITGQIMEYIRDREIYVFNTYNPEGLLDKIIDVNVEDVEAVLLTQVVNGIKDNVYTNFKYGFHLKKPGPKWYFIENPHDTLPFITIAKTKTYNAEDEKFRLYIFGPFENIPNYILDKDNKKMFIDYARNFLIKNFKLYIGYEDGIQVRNGISYFWRIANNFVFANNGSEIKMKYKQLLTISGKFVFVMDYCGDEKKFDREVEKSELPEIIDGFKYILEENIYVQISDIYYYEKDFRKSLEFLKLAIKMQPEKWQLYQKLGDIYGKLGMLKDSKKSFKDALELKGDKIMLKFELDNVTDEFYNGIGHFDSDQQIKNTY